MSASQSCLIADSSSSDSNCNVQVSQCGSRRGKIMSTELNASHVSQLYFGCVNFSREVLVQTSQWNLLFLCLFSQPPPKKTQKTPPKQEKKSGPRGKGTANSVQNDHLRYLRYHLQTSLCLAICSKWALMKPTYMASSGMFYRFIMSGWFYHRASCCSG